MQGCVLVCAGNVFDCSMGVCLCVGILCLVCDSHVGMCLCAVCVCVCVCVCVHVCMCVCEGSIGV